MQIRATYRLQFEKSFGFAEAAAILPYLARLGISHVYASPFLKARPGSTHGYDIVDHNALNPELGSAAAFDHFVAELARHNLRLILDFVPNHMGIGSDNPFWRDVLEWGQASVHAGWFDIDWHAETGGLDGKLLVPLLGEQYGAALAAGHLALAYDGERGGFDITAYGTHVLPLAPDSYAEVLGRRDRVLERLGDAFARIGARRPHERERADELRQRLKAEVEGSATVRAALDAAVARFAGTPGDLASWAQLDRLIGRQRWRLAYFRVAGDDINYRRFFNINELAGLRMEQPAVFDHAHRLVFDLIEQGTLSGLRIDHIDGLFDPKSYLLRLRERAPRPISLHVEKILAQGEDLRADWQADGTTGYEVANLLTGLFIDPASEPTMTALYRRFTGERRPFRRIAREAKFAVIDTEFGSELSGLARMALAIARSNPLTMDFTHRGLERALREIVASFHVYRTYVDEAGASEADRQEIRRAVAEARRENGGLDESIYAFLEGLMTADAVEEPGSGFSREEVVLFAMRLQQLTGPVMAKGVEDTAFYRYSRFIAANEVGGEPGRLGTSVTTFHEANLRRLDLSPLALLTTSTHDTKRGEDLRAHLAAMSGLTGAFVELVPRLAELVAPAAGEVEPNPADLMLLFQTLAGIWPDDATRSEPDLKARLAAALLKSVREAKLDTNWAAPDAAYEDAIQRVVEAVFASDAARQNLVGFARELAPLGAANALAQAVLKLTIPGVPDIYQGAEGWDFSLVDPDNRRPVDFAARSEALARCEADPAAPLTRSDVVSGFAKTAAIWRLLSLRARKPELFAGTYEPIETGDEALVAFARRGGGERLIAVVNRFPWRAAGGTIALPAGRYDSLFGRGITVTQEPVAVADLLGELSVAVLTGGDRS